MASSSSTTWSRNTSATDRATLIAGSGRPRVSRPIELRALMTRASSLPARLESTVYPIAGTSPLAIHLGGLSSPPAGRTSMDESDYAVAAAGNEVEPVSEFDLGPLTSTDCVKDAQ